MVYEAPLEAREGCEELLAYLDACADRAQVEDERRISWQLEVAGGCLDLSLHLWIEAAQEGEPAAIKQSGLDASAAYMCVARLRYELCIEETRRELAFVASTAQQEAWEEHVRSVADTMAAASGDYEASRRWIEACREEYLNP